MTRPDPAREGDSGLSMRDIAEITSEAARLFLQMMQRSLLWGGKTMPAKSKAQQRFFGAELAREREGQKTQTGLSEGKLEEMASKPKGKKLPEKVKAKAKGKT
jgi:hypothetical protein